MKQLTRLQLVKVNELSLFSELRLNVSQCVCPVLFCLFVFFCFGYDVVDIT